MPTLVFDIETIPDVAGLRRLHGIDAALPDGEVVEWALQRRRTQSGNEMLPLHLQRVIVISCVLRDAQQLRIWSLAEPDIGEAQIVQRFFDGIERLRPQLVSWNGGGFDLPVLHARGLIHGVVAGRYWDWGDDDREYRFNNYLNRYHTRHLDLMDVLAMYQVRANSPLSDMAQLCGFPGKLGMSGDAVWPSFQAGEYRRIRDYCETDVVNTYLLHLRFQHMRGVLDAVSYAEETALVRRTLTTLALPHWREFIEAWPERTTTG
ncbi:MAG TPA: 3'-5' exonuclease [Rhodocyclaceae bacterium]|nr:3'-5' exonuclease [Rhodocyclaceae bacterium]